MKNSNEPTEDEIAALNDAMEQESWARLNEDQMGMDADSYNDAHGCSVEFEDYDDEPDFEDDDSALASAGFGMDEDYGYIEDQGFYEYED